MKRSPIQRKAPLKKARKPLKRKAKTPFAKARDRADEAWAKNAKHRQGWACQICGKLYGLETHHYQPKRTYPKLRYDRRNAVVLCARHHRYDAPLSAHHDPAFHDWFKRARPADYEYLKTFKANDSIKRSPEELTEIAVSFEADNRLYESMSEAA